MRIPSRRLGGALAASALLVSLAACGDDKVDSTSATPTSPAASTTTEAPTEGPTEEPTEEPTGTSVDVDDFGARLAASIDGLTTARMAMRITSSGTVIAATGQVDYRGDTPAMAMTMRSAAFGAGKIDLRLVDGVMYMSLPVEGSAGKFYKIDLNDPNNPLGSSFGSLDSFDPKATFDMFTHGVRKVVDLGSEEINGESTTHYQLTITTKQLKKQLGQLGGLPKALTYDLWLDSQDRMSRMQVLIPGSGQMTTDMSHWGEPVDIKAPPARMVATLPSQ